MRRALAWALALGAAGALATGALVASRSGGGAAFERAALSAPAERVRVEVLNAGGVSGVARDATARLRDVGFDVVHFGNARAFDSESSVVIDRVGRPDLAEGVANVLGIGNVRAEPDPNLFVDVTVLLGRTWSGPAGAIASSEPPQRAPWDPRGWLGR
ncbi:MAG TPA: LytR C-terminal domain-containing protein [Longimicrobiales bacterium]|nr:LytR C-terminal domain-containing protein [Longimicrobiales bacterium]